MEVGHGVAEWKSSKGEIRSLDREQLLERVLKLAADERHVVLEFLLHVAEVDRQRAYGHAGAATLWDYLHKVLGFPKCQTSLRYHSVRLLRTFPEVASYLEDGRLSMTTLVLLKDALKPENAKTLLDSASGKSKEDVLYLVAALRARVVPVATITPAPEPKVVPLAPELTAAREALGGTNPDAAEPAALDANGEVVTPPVPAGAAFLVIGTPEVRKIKPVSAEQSVMTVTIDREFASDLEALWDVLSAVVDRGDIKGALHYCMKKELVRAGKRRGTVPVRERKVASDDQAAAARTTASPAAEVSVQSKVGAGTARDCAETSTGDEARAAAPGSREREGDRVSDAPPDGSRHTRGAENRSRPGAGSDSASRGRGEKLGRERDRPGNRTHIPMRVQRTVWSRDEQCCQWRLQNGQICGSRHRCQIDHRNPVARGGKSNLGNLRLLCQMHNLQAEREAFGDAFVDRAIERRGKATTSLAADPVCVTEQEGMR